MTPYGDIDLGQHWFRQWLVAWRHQAITRTNVDLSSVKSCGIHLRAISHEMLKICTLDVSLKITNLRLHPHLPGTNELRQSRSVNTWMKRLPCSMPDHAGHLTALDIFYDVQKYMRITSHFCDHIRVTASVTFHGYDCFKTQSDSPVSQFFFFP